MPFTPKSQRVEEVQRARDAREPPTNLRKVTLAVNFQQADVQCLHRQVLRPDLWECWRYGWPGMPSIKSSGPEVGGAQATCLCTSLPIPTAVSLLKMGSLGWAQRGYEKGWACRNLPLAQLMQPMPGEHPTMTRQISECLLSLELGWVWLQ